VERFDSAPANLVPGERVRAKVTSHENWGVVVSVLGVEHVGASIDAALIDSPSGSPRALPSEYPPIGAELQAVVQQISRYHPPVWLRLTIRATDLECFSWPCGFCNQPTTLSADGDGVVLDVRSTDGPGCTSVMAHRSCLIERLHPMTAGEAARVARLGHN
jgi:hypothetical protein